VGDTTNFVTTGDDRPGSGELGPKLVSLEEHPHQLSIDPGLAKTLQRLIGQIVLLL
jgi:hypothetical protein